MGVIGSRKCVWYVVEVAYDDEAGNGHTISCHEWAHALHQARHAMLADPKAVRANIFEVTRRVGAREPTRAHIIEVTRS